MVEMLPSEEGKGDVQLLLREFNDGSCVQLKGDFNRS